MDLDAVFQQCAYAGYRLWIWLQYEASLNPFIFLGAVVVIVSAWILYKSEVRSK
jgi:hypothetical protein